MDKEKLKQLSDEIYKQEHKMLARRQFILEAKDKRDAKRTELIEDMKQRYDEDKENNQHLSNETKRKALAEKDAELAKILEDIKATEHEVVVLDIDTAKKKREFRIYTMGQ